jgi:dihydropteroate synthase
MIIKIGDNLFDLRKRPLIMGILNVTPDSFSDGGRYYSFDDAINHAIRMEKEGADIIDIGGESTRPGAVSVPISAEMSRVMPVVKELSNKLKVPVSIDTYKSEIAEKAIVLGASMVNDISALRFDEKLAKVVAEKKVPICLMHMKGTPSNMQTNPVYENVVLEIKNFLSDRAKYAIIQGIRKENIIIDPGLGFGKRTGSGIEDNMEILKNLEEFKELGYPILIGSSRKTFIGNVYDDKKPLPIKDRLDGSIETAMLAVRNGANIIRVHDVKETKTALEKITMNGQ